METLFRVSLPVTRALGLVILLSLGVTACQTGQSSETAGGYTHEQIERGRYLVSTSGCHDCHTPWVATARGSEPDMTRALSGHPSDLKMPPAPPLPEGPWLWLGAATNTAYAGPWGTSFAANLTPEENTGLGIWTEETFIKTIRTGRHWGISRPLLPPMPWHVYTNMTDSDLISIFAYLRSIPPIFNEVPEPVIREEITD